MSTALLPLSYALAAPIAAWIGVRDTLVGAGLLGAVVTFGFLFLPGMRGPERHEIEEATMITEEELEYGGRHRVPA